MPKVTKKDTEKGQAGIYISERDARMFKRLEKLIVDEQKFLIPRLTREELILATNVPKNKFAPLFRKCTGKSFNTYLNDFRLEHAAKLLVLHPEYKVEAVAEECGLPKMQTFYRLFLERYKQTPTQYRKKNRQK